MLQTNATGLSAGFAVAVSVVALVGEVKAGAWVVAGVVGAAVAGGKVGGLRAVGEGGSTTACVGGCTRGGAAQALRKAKIING